MELFQMKKSTPVWISFENPTGARGAGGTANHGAKGAAFERFEAGEEKVLCDYEGTGIIRRIWMTLEGPDKVETMRDVRLKMFWDSAEIPAVDLPLGDFFCMNLSRQARFENVFFSSPEGKSFNCRIPMPFRSHAKITLTNLTGQPINHLYYDIDLTLEDLPADALYFHTAFQEVENALEQPVEILPRQTGAGRFLGMSMGIFANAEAYGVTWWGEGEVKIYLDGDQAYPSLCGTGTEDYIGTAWSLGPYANLTQGAPIVEPDCGCFYRFHTVDPIYFQKDCRVVLQTIGGAAKEEVLKMLQNGSPLVPITMDGQKDFYCYYGKEAALTQEDDSGWVNFYRQDRYRAVAYYYLNQK